MRDERDPFNQVKQTCTNMEIISSTQINQPSKSRTGHDAMRHGEL
jgi:hypothetical protein